MTLKSITELPPGEYILACHKAPDLSHAFIVFGEAGIVALAKQSGFQYRAGYSGELDHPFRNYLITSSP